MENNVFRKFLAISAYQRTNLDKILDASDKFWTLVPSKCWIWRFRRSTAFGRRQGLRRIQIHCEICVKKNVINNQPFRLLAGKYILLWLSDLA